MKTICIHPSQLKGEINIQISKSDAHRTLIVASLAKTKSIITPWNKNLGFDVYATKNILETLGLATFIEHDDNNTLECIPSKDWSFISLLFEFIALSVALSPRLIDSF